MNFLLLISTILSHKQILISKTISNKCTKTFNINDSKLIIDFLMETWLFSGKVVNESSQTMPKVFVVSLCRNQMLFKFVCF